MSEEWTKRLSGMIATSGFDRALTGLELLDAGDGKARARLVVGPHLQNMNGTLHGGAIATLVDDVGTLAIITGDRNTRPGVTTDLNVSYFSAGLGGSAVVIDGTVLKIGKTMAFVSVEIRRESDGVLVAQGRMTKHLG